MNRRWYYRFSLTVFPVFCLFFLTACVCWPGLPGLIHQDGCAQIQPMKKSGGAIPPPRPKIVHVHTGDIWIMNQDGAEKKQLTKTTEREFSPSVSRRVERIWFIRADAASTESSQYGDVYSCDFKGGDVKRITEGLKIRFAVVSPYGDKLAIAVIRSIPDILPGGQAGDTADMWIIEAGAENQTGAEGYVDLSKDLAASGVGGREGSTYLAWSPSNDRVAFTFKPDGSSSLGISTKDVYLATASGKGIKKLIAGADEPCFNAVGDMVVATTGAHWDTMGVTQVSVDGGFSDNLLAWPTASPLYSTYTPFWTTTWDAEQHNLVIYSKTTHPAEPGIPVNTLEKCDLKTDATTEIVTKNGAENIITQAAPDFYSGKIVFQVGRNITGVSANASIWTVKPDGQALTQVASGPEDSEPVWAWDNSWWKTGGGTAGTTGTGCHWPYQAKSGGQNLIQY